MAGRNGHNGNGNGRRAADYTPVSVQERNRLAAAMEALDAEQAPAPPARVRVCNRCNLERDAKVGLCVCGAAEFRLGGAIPEVLPPPVAGSVPVYELPAGDDIDPPEPVSRPWPEPPSREAYRGLAGEIVRSIEPSTEADPAAILVQFLTVFGCYVGRHACIGHWLPEPHFANLYCLMVGQTAMGAKGESLGWALRPFAELDPEWEVKHIIPNGLSSGEGLADWLQDLGEDRRCLFYESEFSKVLKMGTREGNCLPEALRQGWDSDRMTIRTRHNSVTVTGAHLAGCAHVTGTELLGRLSQYDLHGGSFNRYLWCCCRRVGELPMGGARVCMGMFKRRIASAVDAGGRRGMLRFDAAAERLWRDEYHRLWLSQPGAYGAATTRARPQVLRLSLIYALLDRAAEVQEPHLRSALAMWDYCDRSAAYIFGDGVGDRDVDRLLEELRAAGELGLNGTEISAVFGRNRNRRELGLILGKLKDSGLAEVREYHQVGHGGAPGKRWYARSVKSNLAENEGNRQVRTNE